MAIFHICHLYGNLLNTYGDNGNLLMLAYQARCLGYEVETTLVTLNDVFDPERYHLVFMGGGQDYEQKVIARDLSMKKDALQTYIENDGTMLAICGGYQLLGRFYETAHGEHVEGAGLLSHETRHQKNHRFIGDIVIQNDAYHATYKGFENHNGRTFLGPDEQPLGRVIQGHGNNGEDQTEGAIYRNVYCSYFHGPLLVRNPDLGARLVRLALG